MTIMIPSAEANACAASTLSLAEHRGHFTWIELISDDGMHDLVVFVSDDAELDDSFEATCAETGDLLTVNGWLYVVAD